MKQHKTILTLVLLLAPFFLPSIAAAQSAKPTAAQDIQLTVFGAVSGVYTGLAGGKNLSLTAGGDLALAPWHGMRPTLEVRGTKNLVGTIVGQKDVLGGLRLDFLLGRRVHPYGDFLFGRGEMDYGSTCATNNGPVTGYSFDNTCYSVTTTYVYSPGAGFDYDLTNHFAIKVDGQYQQWGSVPTASGTLHSTIGTIGLVYRFGKFGMP